MAKEKVNMYLLAIVAIVAVVGIVVLVLNAGTTFLPISDDDLSGQASKTTPSSLGVTSMKTTTGYSSDAVVLGTDDKCGSQICDSSQNCACDDKGKNCRCIS